MSVCPQRAASFAESCESSAHIDATPCFEPASFTAEQLQQRSVRSLYTRGSHRRITRLASSSSRTQEKWLLDGDVLSCSESKREPAREYWVVDVRGRPSGALGYVHKLSGSVDLKVGQGSTTTQNGAACVLAVQEQLHEELSTLTDESETNGRVAVDYMRRTGSFMQDQAMLERRTHLQSRRAVELDRVGELPLNLETRPAVELRRCVSACVRSTAPARASEGIRDSRRALEFERLETLPLHLATRPALDVERESAPIQVQILSRSSSQISKQRQSRTAEVLKPAAPSQPVSHVCDSRAESTLGEDAPKIHGGACSQYVSEEPKSLFGISRMFSLVGKERDSTADAPSRSFNSRSKLTDSRSSNRRKAKSGFAHDSRQPEESLKAKGPVTPRSTKGRDFVRHFSKRDRNADEIRRTALAAVQRANQSRAYETRTDAGSSTTTCSNVAGDAFLPSSHASEIEFGTSAYCSMVSEASLEPAECSAATPEPVTSFSKIFKLQRRGGLAQFVSRVDSTSCCRNIEHVCETMGQVELYTKRSSRSGSRSSVAAGSIKLHLVKRLEPISFSKLPRIEQTLTISVEITPCNSAQSGAQCVIDMRLVRALDRASPGMIAAFTALCNSILAAMRARDLSFARLSF
eukprot:CAMPEP_0185844798 /NCGR_PEP_ID=MMETSP1354-20130828/906_1 /TAXON_ID=708628 /ORGANISM="Erythrolobus madagascarensis, Strain CCMP3276" /LENGTH=635 /DNA_ID=CAMNT_0028544573 /DNA_START=145 /DNA_END=2052 /DNA_ORIENTATION=+